VNTLPQLKQPTSLLTIALLLAFGLMPRAKAVVPPPDGGYPRFNTAEGQNALFSLTTGSGNTAVGWLSLRSNATGNFNTAIGAGSLVVNTADENTATGAGALLSNTTGIQNAANGVLALFSNTEGDFNTANGVQALFSNTTGDQNTANGNGALFSNTTGHHNTADGVGALFSNAGGSSNTAIGTNSLFSNATASGNTAVGGAALSNTTSDANTAIGLNALFHNATGVDNTALGNTAGFNITGSSNICIGQGVAGVAGQDYTIRIGDNLPSTAGASRCYIGGIWAQQVTGNFTAVNVDNFGQLGLPASSRRFKHHIRPMDKCSEVILRLKPVTFQYKGDAKNTPCVGLIAEEVADVSPVLVLRDWHGELVTVRYDAVNVMVLNEFLKEHKKVEE
jgi:Chaperone of endosialidase